MQESYWVQCLLSGERTTTQAVYEFHVQFRPGEAAVMGHTPEQFTSHMAYSLVISGKVLRKSLEASHLWYTQDTIIHGNLSG